MCGRGEGCPYACSRQPAGIGRLRQHACVGGPRSGKAQWQAARLTQRREDADHHGNVHGVSRGAADNDIGAKNGPAETTLLGALAQQVFLRVVEIRPQVAGIVLVKRCLRGA